MDGGVKVAPQERNPGIEPHETKRNESNNSFSGSSVLHGAGAALHGAGAVLHRLEHRLEHSANAALHRLTPGAAMQALQRKESAKKMQDAARKAAHDMQTHFSSAFKNSSGATSNKAPLDDLQHDSMAAHVAEVLKRAKGRSIQDKDSDAHFTRMDKLSYLLENYVASHSNAMLKILCLVTLGIILFFGTAWGAIDNLGHSTVHRIDAAGRKHYEPAPRPLFSHMGEHWFNAFQMLATGGFESGLGRNVEEGAYRYMYQLFFVVLLMLGLVVFAVLVGIITSTFEHMMSSIEQGETKVAENKHTLILGWNESTLRVVCQIALLRRVWRIQNETWLRRMFPWLRTIPSTPVAKYPVVIMCNNKGKAEMDTLLANALAQRGISPKRTMIGWDVVCRIGDPTSVHDLVRINASSAQSILVMMTTEDHDEFEASHGKVVNGATINTLLAVRTAICGSKIDWTAATDPTSDMRIVVQLEQTSVHVTAACFRSSAGKKLVEALDLTLFVNTLLFRCASVRNLSQVVTSIMDFEGPALRCRPIMEIPAGPHGVKGWLKGKSFRKACQNNCWEKSVLVGCTSDKILYTAKLSSVYSSVEDMQGEQKHDALSATGNAYDFGLVPEADHVFTEDDFAIFVSQTSLPRVSGKVDTETQQAAVDGGEFNKTPLSQAKLTEGMMVLQKLIVCGWRMQWTEDHARLKTRITEVGKNAKEGSYITFMNQLTTEDFAEHLELPKTGKEHDEAETRIATELKRSENEEHPPKGLPAGTRGWRVEGCRNLRIYHIQGDASNFADLQPLLMEPDTYSTALVLATQANNIKLPPVSMDRRLLSILLLFKHLTLEWSTPPHVISENQIDQTADIAVTPGGIHNEPDFVNTQAISARALVLALAYPRMQPAINELFDDQLASDGTPEFALLPCEMLLRCYGGDVGGSGNGGGGDDLHEGMKVEARYYEAKEGPKGPELEFGSIQKLVYTIFSERGIAIGYMLQDGMVQNAPGITAKRVWAKEDRIIILHRRYTDEALAAKNSVMLTMNKQRRKEHAETHAAEKWLSKRESRLTIGSRSSGGSSDMSMESLEQGDR